MTHSTPLSRFLALTAAAGALLVLAVAQVPQPWRGVLVAWVIFGSSVGFLAARLARHYQAYVSTPSRRRPPPAPTRRRGEGMPPRATPSLKVVVSKAAANGRRTI